MRRFVVALLGATVLGGVAANAADMPVKAPPAPVAVPFNWTGWYLGLNGGYIWGNSTLTDVTGYNSAGSSFSYKPRGFQGGGQIGYNWQINQFVFGLEGELGYISWKKSAQYPPFVGVRGPNDSVAETTNGAFGVIAGRVGVAFDRVLVFAKGGAIFTGIKNSFTDTDATGTTLVSGTDTSHRNGWTAGGGVEYAITRNWIARLEYAHYGFGTKSHTATSAGGASFVFDHKLSGDSVRGGISYLFH